MATRHNNPLKFKSNIDFRDLSKFDKITDSGIYFINDLYDVINTLNDEMISKPRVKEAIEGFRDYSPSEKANPPENYQTFYKGLIVDLHDPYYNTTNTPTESDKRSDEGKFILGGDEFDNGDEPFYRFDTKGGYPSFLNSHGLGTSSYRGYVYEAANKISGIYLPSEIRATPINYDKDNNYPAKPRGATIWRDYDDVAHPSKKGSSDTITTTTGEDPFALLGILIVQGTDNFCIQKFINREYIFYRYKFGNKWGNWKHNIPNVTEYVDVENYGETEYKNGIRKDFFNTNYPLGFGSVGHNKGWVFHPKDIYEIFKYYIGGTKPFTESEFNQLVENRIKKSEIEDMVKKNGDTALGLYTNGVIKFDKKNGVYGHNTTMWIGEYPGSPKLEEGENIGLKYKVPDGLLNIISHLHYKDLNKEATVVGDRNMNLLFYVPSPSGLAGRSSSANFLSGYVYDRPFVNYPGTPGWFTQTFDLGDAMVTKSKKWERLYIAGESDYISTFIIPGSAYEVLIFTKFKPNTGGIYKKFPTVIHEELWETYYQHPNRQSDPGYGSNRYDIDKDLRTSYHHRLRSSVNQGEYNLYENIPNLSSSKKGTASNFPSYLKRRPDNSYELTLGKTSHSNEIIGYNTTDNIQVYIDKIYVKYILNM